MWCDRYMGPGSAFRMYGNALPVQIAWVLP
jgi:hypothetical protein